MLWGAALVVAGAIADYYLYPQWSGVGESSHDHGRNGLWLRYHWYFGQKSGAEVERLGRDLFRHGIRYAYFHVRDVTAQGRLRFNYPHESRALNEEIHDACNSVRTVAWVYIGNVRGKGEVDLGDASVRQMLVDEATWLVGEGGFDGIQWDYEVCADGDDAFPLLLRETRAALPPEKLVGVTTPVWMPGPLRRWGWSEEYFGRIAELCDQVVVMCYDTGAYTPRAYVWLVRQQAIRVTRAVHSANPACGVLLGMPTYGDENSLRSHNAHAENLRLGLKGVREGLACPRAAPAAFDGVAVFANWTTEPEEWGLYQTLWRETELLQKATGG